MAAGPSTAGQQPTRAAAKRAPRKSKAAAAAAVSDTDTEEESDHDKEEEETGVRHGRRNYKDTQS